MTITTIISTIIASLANLPMTLESGLSFPIGNWSPSEATRILMENSPFYISMTSNGGIQLTNSKGQWITRTSPIVEAKSFDNGYCYFVTESGHKYQFADASFMLSNQTQKVYSNSVSLGVCEAVRTGILPENLVIIGGTRFDTKEKCIEHYTKTYWGSKEVSLFSQLWDLGHIIQPRLIFNDEDACLLLWGKGLDNKHIFSNMRDMVGQHHKNAELISRLEEMGF